jgi:hypothetical protein
MKRPAAVALGYWNQGKMEGSPTSYEKLLLVKIYF